MKHFRTLTAMLLAAMIAVSAAAVFTPSVEYKEAPSIVEKTDDNGNAIAGEIKNSKGEVVGTVSSGAIKITALSTVKTETTDKTDKTDKIEETDKEKPADKEVDEKVKERLLAAEAELAEAFEDPENSVLLKQISEELNNAPVENIVISDVFHLEATEEISALLEENVTVSVSVVSQSITKEDEEVIVIYQKVSETGGWKKVEFTIGDDDVITMELQGTGDIIILRDSEALPPELAEEAPASPSTSGDTAKAVVQKKPIIKRSK